MKQEYWYKTLYISTQLNPFRVFVAPVHLPRMAMRGYSKFNPFRIGHALSATKVLFIYLRNSGFEWNILSVLSKNMRFLMEFTFITFYFVAWLNDDSLKPNCLSRLFLSNTILFLMKQKGTILCLIIRIVIIPKISLF